MGLKDKVLVVWHDLGFVRVSRHFGTEATESEYLDIDKDLPMIEQTVRRSEDANRQADELGGRI